MNFIAHSITLLLVIPTLALSAPFNLFEPYDINIKLRKPGPKHLHMGILAEQSYAIKGYATDQYEEETLLVNPLQIYEPEQNVVSMYQGFDAGSSLFIDTINEIAGGAGGGVSTLENGLFKPCGNLKIGQVAMNAIYGIPHGFYIGAYMPFYFAQMNNTQWCYQGDETLFSGSELQLLADAFVKDSSELFGLSLYNWKKSGPGDLTFLLEWQDDFPQLRTVLKTVQPNLRVGLSIPTGCIADPHVIMAPPFGAQGAASIPFGGGLNIDLAHRVDVGFTAQFWYYWDTNQPMRIKTFPTQTSLLFPTVTDVIYHHTLLQNFNLYAAINGLSKRLCLKFCYQYWRQGESTVTPINPRYDTTIANTAPQLQESTMHDVFLSLTYSPRAQDFKKVFPQAQLFWKASVKGMRSAVTSTAGLQFSLIF